MKQLNDLILINNEMLVGDFQKLFTSRYPYLKIEFLQIEMGNKKLKSINIDQATPMLQIKNIGALNKININKNITIGDLTHKLEALLGVITQVFRKCGNVWNVISLTSEWTLENQNASGLFISNEMNSKTSYNKKTN